MPDHRHNRRQKLFQDLFACTFNQDRQQECVERLTALEKQENQTSVVLKILRTLDELDEKIRTVALERPLNDINKVDLAIMRLILFESLDKKTPKKVLLNEAIEIAKLFGSESSAKLINGALAKLLLED